MGIFRFREESASEPIPQVTLYYSARVSSSFKDV